jgi:molybdopterin molybdotransferase
MIPVKVAGYQVFPVEYHGSAHINAYTLADGILTIAPGVTEIQTGELVNVRLL